MKHMALKKNLDVTIHEAFLEEILQGNWKPGQALNLDDLAERYGVSRTPIQQALKRMHTQGMVVFSSKGHFSVPTFSEKEVCDIIEMRLLLEHQALTDIQNKLLPMDFETLERLAAAGCRIYRTDLQGNITLRIGAAVETERSDSQ